MIVVVIVLAVVAVLAIVLIVVGRSRLVRSLGTVTAERDAATARATEAEAARDEARIAVDAATTRATEAEVRATEAADRNGVDPQVLWALEQARSERTWRQSVAVGEGSFLDGADDPLLAALHVELDAAREDVGAIVELDAELPAPLTPAGSVLVLRAAQELLAGAVKAAEETTLRVHVDGDDVLVTIEATDEAGAPVAIEALAIPESADVAPAEGGVRIRRAVAR